MKKAKDGCAPSREKYNVSKVKVSEHGKSAVFLNPTRGDVFVTKIDGGLVENEIAADYVVSKPGVGDVIVELKGKEVDRGCKQILATAKLLDKCGAKRGPVSALIVCTRVPSNDASISRMKNEFLQKHRTRLHIRAGNLEHDFERLLGSK